LIAAFALCPFRDCNVAKCHQFIQLVTRNKNL
jgi:hypothetical protein